MTSSDWVDSSSACKILGVRRQTLYAYVSRKMVRTCADAADARRSLYSRADVEALARRSSRPRARAYVAAGAIRWGDPVLATSVSGVRDGELYFGAMNACDCAASMSLEDIAAHHYRAAQFLAPSIESPIPPGDTPLNRALHYLAEESDASEPVMGRDRQAHALDGMRLLTGFVDALLGERRNGPAHARLKAAWGLNDRSAEAVRRALVLLSDHELNPSTFAVRVCASTGASLPASLLAGLATLSGPLHGGVCRRASEAIRAASTSEAALEAFLADAGETSAYGYGFGHPLYPEGRSACRLSAGRSGPLRALAPGNGKRGEARRSTAQYRRRTGGPGRSASLAGGCSVPDFRHRPNDRLDRTCHRAGGERKHHSPKSALPALRRSNSPLNFKTGLRPTN